MKIEWRSVEEKCADLCLAPKDPNEWRRICLFGQGRDEAPHGRVLYAVVRAFRPQQIIEVGTARGFSALVMALAQRDAGLHDGKIMSIDVIPHDEPRAWHNPARHVPHDPAANGPVSREDLLKDFS